MNKNVTQWLLKKIAGSISQEEERLLDDWANQSAENSKLVERVTGEEFISRTVLDHNKAAQQRTWLKIHNKIGYRHSFLHRMPRFIGAAAAVLLLIGGMTLWLHLGDEAKNNVNNGNTPIIYMATRGYTIEGSAVKFSQYVKEQADEQVNHNVKKAEYTEITVPMGGEYKIVLQDSTRLHLNSGSTLHIPNNYSAANRSVYISGEAYMEVHHDEAHPFTVHTDRMDVKVLGTKFNIDAYKGEKSACVTLVEGKVEAATKNKKAILTPGQEAVATVDRLEVHMADTYENTAWHNGRIVFVNRTLENIMRHLARWYNFTPEYASQQVRTMRMTIDIDRHGTFRQVADMIEKTNGIKININKNKVLLTEK